MRAWLVVIGVASAACDPVPSGGPVVYAPVQRTELPTRPVVAAPERLGALDGKFVDFAFEGGQLEFAHYRDGDRVVQVVQSRYAVPVMLRWNIGALENLEPHGAVEGVVFVPPAREIYGLGEAVVLARFRMTDVQQPYRRELTFRARFGDPRAEPEDYAYRLPYATGLAYSVLQGFHGTFSHRGSNEYAVDFDCPVATTVVAARPGTVVAANASALRSGLTPEYLDYKRTNFVLILHADGTLGEYMHLSPSSLEVKAGQQVERGQPLALSGNTGYSSTPHLHFQVMTAALDGVSARSFPFELAVAPDRVEAPVQGRRYSAWE